MIVYNGIKQNEMLTFSTHEISKYIQSIKCYLLSRVQLSVISWTAAGQASLSITNSQSLLKCMPLMLLRPSNHLILCHPLLIRVFSNESVLRIR